MTYPHLILGVIPITRVVAVTTWLQKNADPSFDLTTAPELNVAGDDGPATHVLFHAPLKDVAARELLRKMCADATVVPPTVAQWTAATPQQKRLFVLFARDALFTAIGVYIDFVPNARAGRTPVDTVLKTVGLKLRKVKS